MAVFNVRRRDLVSETVLVVKGLRKRYGDVVALDGISLEVQRG